MDKVENMGEESVFKRVVTVEGSSGVMKVQFIVNVTPYNTSTMDNYKEGDKIYKGYTCQLATIKPSKKYPRQSINIDPSDRDIRRAIEDMYESFDALGIE